LHRSRLTDPPSAALGYNSTAIGLAPRFVHESRRLAATLELHETLIDASQIRRIKALKLKCNETMFFNGTVRRAAQPITGGQVKLSTHQYVERDSGEIREERPFGDWVVNYLYCRKREQAPIVYQLLGSQWFSGFLGWVNYDFPLGSNLSGVERFLKNCAIDVSECLDHPHEIDTARKVFERRIRYWACRPMCDDESASVSPADARLILGSFKETSRLVLKGKFFDYEGLIGAAQAEWQEAFRGGDFVVCRLTPDKYHYNPYSGFREGS
jgi:hypothetical protein